MDQGRQSQRKRNCLILLRQILETRFNEEELRTLCFDLGIEYDSISGSSTASKARELVALLDRHNRVLDLIETGQEQRTDIKWPEEQCIVEVIDKSFEEIRKLPKSKGSLKRLSRALNKFGRFVEEVEEWKELHNILHDFDNNLENVLKYLRRLEDQSKQSKMKNLQHYHLHSYTNIQSWLDACQKPLSKLVAFGKTIKHIKNPVDEITSYHAEVKISLKWHDLKKIIKTTQALRDVCAKTLYMADKELRDHVRELDGLYKSIMRSI